MLTVMEIRNHQFKTGLRGYPAEEVNNFIAQLAQDYEQLYTENATQKDQIQRLEFELNKYKKLEETMNTSLILAQQTANDVRENARKEAAMMLNDSKQHIAQLLSVYQDVVKRLSVFNAELKGQIQGQLDLLDQNQKRVDELTGFFYSKDLKETLEAMESLKLEAE